jgi:tRNA threonylcarbamoyl adenosine modification protein (Sua5/YciO/YrdC/YwlC family)
MNKPGQIYFKIGSEESCKHSRDTIITIAEAIDDGKIAILPTSTIYGLSCAYNNKSALDRIYEVKQRPKAMPFIILISDIADLDILADKKNAFAEALIKKYWMSLNLPPVTIIFEKNKNLPGFITGGSGHIALRLESLQILKDIVKICGPIVSTSATVSGSGQSPVNIFEIPEIIRNNVDIIVDVEEDLAGVASTIIDVTGDMPVIAREGKVSRLEIMQLFKNFQ